jgi:hypothetical protein
MVSFFKSTKTKNKSTGQTAKKYCLTDWYKPYYLFTQ